MSSEDQFPTAIFGQGFVYEQLHPGNAHEAAFDRLGQVEIHNGGRLLRGYMEHHGTWRGFMGKGARATVRPYPGSEKHLARWFRHYEGNLIKILEIPQQHDYTGMLLPEFLQTRRVLDESEVQQRLAAGQPVFHRGYCRSWSRLLYRKWDQGFNVVEVDLTPLNDRQWPEIGAIHFRVHSTEPYPDYADYATLPDEIRDQIGEMVGEDVAARLLAEDFLAEFTVEKLKAYSRSTFGTRMNLDEIRSAIAA